MATVSPALSVIVPVYNVRAYLPACLDSVLSQSLTNLEVIVVDDGSTDGSDAVIAAYAARDKRVRAYRKENAGQGAARNFAMGYARGRFVTFLDADDMVPPGAYRYMIDVLRRTGSDFAVGAARRVQNGRYSRPSWNAVVHDRDRIGITIDEFPTALADVIACNRMFRREFWTQRIGGFPEGVMYEDHMPMVAAYIRAARFDLLARVTYDWRLREDQTSTGQQKHQLRNLTDRIRVKADTHAIVRAEASPQVYAAWLGRVLDTDLAAYIQHALRADDEYRELLSAAMSHYHRLAPPEALAYVRVQQKVRSFLAGRGDWAAIEEAEQFFRDFGSVPPTEVQDGRVVIGPELPSSVSRHLPAELLELSRGETRLRACASDARWLSGTTLRLTGWAYIANIDLEFSDHTVEVWLERLDGSERTEVPVDPVRLPEATRWAGWRHGRFDRAGFHATLDFANLDRSGRGVWRLRFRLSVDGIVREGGLHHGLAGSPAARAAIRSSPATAGMSVTPHYDPEHGLTFGVASPVAVATELVATFVDREIVARFRSTDHAFEPIDTLARNRAAGLRIDGRVVQRDDGIHEMRFSLPVLPPGESGTRRSEWDLFVTDRHGRREPLTWPETTDLVGPDSEAIVPAVDMHWKRSPRGQVRAIVDAAFVEATHVQLDGSRLVLHIRHRSVPDQLLKSLRLSGPNVDVISASFESHGDGSARVQLPLVAREFGLDPRALRPGPYAVVGVDPDGLVHPIGVAGSLASSMPIEVDTGIHRVRVAHDASGSLRINLLAPLAQDELSNRDQQELKGWYSTATLPSEEAVLFQCYRGEVATDSQVALHDELRRRDRGLTLYWGISDRSAWLPDGATPLVIGSREWYAKLSTVRYLCNNVDFDGFFRKRPHQRYLQTFHGYPFKSMGRSFWSAKGNSPGRIEREIARRNAEWDAILVPAPFCEAYYREEYAYTGEVLALGYPRTDPLVNDAATATAAEVRGRLGVPADATVVLYAPTYRDVLTTRVYAAKRFDVLDLDLLCRTLGDRYVILLRGHNNNQREPERVRGRATVIDVTDYPEINDLTLAADVAVLDYSSLRFDWALTRKPMVFFVPDLDAYFATRPPLFDFESSAPGPLLATTEAVASALANLGQLTRRYAGDIAAFNERFNRLHDGAAAKRVADAFFT